MKKSSIIAVAIFGIAMIAAVWIGGSYFNKARGRAKTVSVVGMAQRDFTSDLIVWDISYSVLNDDLKQGYTDLKGMTQIVNQYLLNKGVKENEMTFEAVSNYKETDYRYNDQTHTSQTVFLGYRLTQRVRIESGNVDQIEKLYREIPELLDQGISIDNNSLSFYYTKLADLKVEMLAEATENARTRAETIAKSAGARLGGLQVANMGVFQITAPNSTDEDFSWGGAYNTTSKQKRASINMRLTYNVK